MEVIDGLIVRSICSFHDPKYVFRHSNGMLGGILLVWNSLLWQMQDVYIGSFSISVLVKDVRKNVQWVATSVYGPNDSSY